MDEAVVNKRLYQLLRKTRDYEDSFLRSLEKELLQSYTEALKRIKENIATMFEKYGDKIEYSEMVSYNRLTNLERQIATEIKKLTEKNIKVTESGLKILLNRSYYGVNYAVQTALNAELLFGQLKESVIEAALINPYDRISWQGRIKDHAKSLVNSIRNELTQGLIQGHGYSKIANTITDKAKINAGKILRIIRTEGHRVQNAGRVVGYDSLDKISERLRIKIFRVWISTLDSRTRDSHRSMDGQIATNVKGKYFWKLPSGALTEAPGLSGIAEEDINCRCTTILKFDNIPYKYRKDNISKGRIKNITYKEWMKRYE